MGIGSQTGADVDANLSFYTTKDMEHDAGLGGSISGGTGFNSRSGLKDLSFNVEAGTERNKIGRREVGLLDYSTTIPIGLQNYVPVVTSQSTQSSFQFQIKGGSEVVYTFPHLYLNAMITNVSYDQNGSRQGFGYMYAENADPHAITDFSRDKDGIYNKTLPNLPPSAMTYDIYSVSGQGTGGMFRPFRNDIGTISDPYMTSTGSGSDVLAEFGVGDIFEAGADLNFYNNTNTSGPWKTLSFGSTLKGSIYEKVFFKAGGELTYNQQQTASQIFNTAPEYLNESMNLIGKGKSFIGVLPAAYNGTHVYWDGTNVDRSSRANLFTFLTAKEASTPEFSQSQQITSYTTDLTANGYFAPAINKSNRYDVRANAAKSYHIGEITQTLPDGRRYVYSLPVMNNMSREATFAVNESNANLNTGMVKIVRGGGHDDDSKGNQEGKDNFYSSTNTPAYAHSYLLTSVLSNDYVDVMGDGPTDDDLGSFVKYNYTKVDTDYRWRSPYSADPSTDSAQYNPGWQTDNSDGRGSYMIGSRQVWHLRSIESKNYIAEFYISQRDDGMGVKSAVLPSTSQLIAGSNLATTSTNSHSYKLDSIVLYNKHDRYINESNATPIKTVVFQYNYNLCHGIPNTFSPGNGKLTLQKIFIKYGKSGKNLLSPYVFSYNNPNPNYDFSSKDRWGNYKKNNPALPNVEFPYAQQDGTGLNDTLSSWNLTDIKLPSGGKIHVQYESDDYSFVQDRRSMQMDMILGVGSSPNVENKSNLYEDANTVNTYVYFKRRQSLENPALSFRNNYLEGNDLLYYNFSLDITGAGRYEFIKGYASVDSVGICPNDNTCGFVKLKKVNEGSLQLHPATVYGLNVARYYLPQVLYHGFDQSDGGSNFKQIILGLVDAAKELGNIGSNPFNSFINDGKGKNINITKSWVRLQVPGLTKKGGGIRVKQLTLNDSWNVLSGNTDSSLYGKQYDYTIADSRYGTISSGVASYEPLVGGDENPFRLPVNYTAEGGRLLPAIDFYQEEPYGEQFFPSPVVGYSSVKVKSIHAAEARSSQSYDEYLFYTAKDFPVSVDYTEKDDPGPYKSKTLTSNYEEEKVQQGYALTFNDMHGKPRAVNNYIIKTDGVNVQNELITGVKYNYQTDANGKLSNTVKAFMRQRGTKNTYAVNNITLGQDVDFTVDSRERNFSDYRTTVKLNLNTVLWGIFPIPVPTVFTPDKQEQQIFRTMVSTKIIQQYGILQSIETFDHGAKTTQQNIIYDAETGTPLLTQTNNEFNDNDYSLKYPAYLAYTGMGLAYTNVGFEEIVDSMLIDANHQPVIYSNNLSKYSPGDELLVTYKDLSNIQQTRKFWITNIGIDTFGTGAYRDSSYTYQQQRISYDYWDGYPPDTGWHWDTTYYPVTVDTQWYAGTHSPNKCGLISQPRYLSKNSVYWSDTGLFHAVDVKVMRSGHRNNLDKNVQETVFTQNPYSSSVNDLFTASGTNAFSKLLGITVNTYMDSAYPYNLVAGSNTAINKFTLPTSPYVSGDVYANFNNYVLGSNGNYRSLSEYTSLAPRSYASNHVRYDGIFNPQQFLWSFINSYSSGGCSSSGNVLLLSTPNSEYWKNVHTVTKYDASGNALEEKDAIGNYSSAQYGYNKMLPVAVATNANQKAFFFDGFEDYNMLMPEYVRRMHYTSAGTYGIVYDTYPFSPFMVLFGNFRLFGTGSGTTDATMLSRAGQRYGIVDSNGAYSGGYKITTEASHSGNYSLKVPAGSGLYVNTYVAAINNRLIETFNVVPSTQYVYDLWMKPISGNASTVANLFTVTYGSAVTHMQLKTNSIDGWYLVEATINPSTGTSAVLYIPQNVYVDDVRMLPSNANMKSFVYDPLTFKLNAQLDENHFATFYEYDQEGLLVRVKKETDRGVLTVSESRRANEKK
jgi:hypothetical protein